MRRWEGSAPPQTILPLERDVEVAFKLGRIKRSTICPTCDGTGSFATWVREPFGEVDTFECDCADQLLIYRGLGARGIEAGHQRRGYFDLFCVDASVSGLVDEWRIDPAGSVRYTAGLILTGVSGSGKTFAASLMMRYALMAGIEAQMLDSNMLNDNWREDDIKHYWMSRVHTTPLLVLDRFGEGILATDWARFRLEEALRARDAAGLATILTTGLTPTQIREKVGGVSRFIDSFQHVKVTGIPYPRQRLLDEERKHRIIRPVVMG